MSIYEEDALTVRHPYPRYFEPLDFGNTKLGITDFSYGVTPEAFERMKALNVKYQTQDIVITNQEEKLWRDSSIPFTKKTYQELLKEAQTDETKTTIKKAINESGSWGITNWWLILLIAALVLSTMNGSE